MRERRNALPPISVVYGLHAVEELLAARVDHIDHIYFAADRRSRELFALMKQCRSLRVNYSPMPESRLTHLAGAAKHQGVVALCAVKPYAAIEDIETAIAASARPALVVVPASVEDPRNLGSLIRSCVAFGVHAIVLERKHTAPLSAATAKASAGMIEHAAIARPRNLENVIAAWRQRGWIVAGADMGGVLSPEQIDFAQPAVVILGGEHRGIPPYLKKQCTHTIRIPMAGPASSLNVSAAGAIILYECVRQRAAAHP